MKDIGNTEVVIWCFALVYMFTSFIMMDANPDNWDVPTRLSSLLAAGVGSGFGLLVKHGP